MDLAWIIRFCKDVVAFFKTSLLVSVFKTFKTAFNKSFFSFSVKWLGETSCAKYPIVIREDILKFKISCEEVKTNVERISRHWLSGSSTDAIPKNYH